MNKTSALLLSSVIATAVVTVSEKAYEDKFNTYVNNNLTQLETMLDGWKDGYNQLKSSLSTEVEKANTEIERLDGMIEQYETDLKTVGDNIKAKVDAEKTEYNAEFETSIESEELAE